MAVCTVGLRSPALEPFDQFGGMPAGLNNNELIIELLFGRIVITSFTILFIVRRIRLYVVSFVAVHFIH